MVSSKIPEISTAILDNFFLHSGLNAIKVMDNYLLNNTVLRKTRKSMFSHVH